MTQALTTQTQATPALLSIQHQWALIARDVAMLSQPHQGTLYSAEQIATTYDITEEEFAVLCSLPVFIEMVRSELERFKAMGPFAGHRIRAEAMAADIQEQLYLATKSEALEPKYTIRFLEMLLRSAGLDAPIESKKAEASKSGVGVNVTINVPQLPNNRKLDHLTGNASVIDTAAVT